MRWYFPEAMGIIAAAKELNISTIEVQHGKQGQFQAHIQVGIFSQIKVF